MTKLPPRVWSLTFLEHSVYAIQFFQSLNRITSRCFF